MIVEVILPLVFVVVMLVGLWECGYLLCYTRKRIEHETSKNAAIMIFARKTKRMPLVTALCVGLTPLFFGLAIYEQNDTLFIMTSLLLGMVILMQLSQMPCRRLIKEKRESVSR